MRFSLRSEFSPLRGTHEESESAAIEVLPILGQSAATVQPSDRTFDNPTLGSPRYRGNLSGMISALWSLWRASSFAPNRSVAARRGLSAI